jgi:hypothetical protein
VQKRRESLLGILRGRCFEMTRSMIMDLQKSELELMLGYSDKIPESSLSIWRGIGCAALNDLPYVVSAALVAIGEQSYVIGFIPSATVQRKNEQPKPIMINHEMVARELREFRENPYFRRYELHIIQPQTTLRAFVEQFEFLPSYVPVPKKK